MKSILFIGGYPNKNEPTKNCFFQNLIYSIADSGIKCTVISPVSITHYKRSINTIIYTTSETTHKGSTVDIFFPRYISYSAKTIGSFKTGRITEASFQRAVYRTIKKENIQFDIVYGHFFLEGGLAAVKIGKLYNKPSYVAFGESNYQECILDPYGEITKNDLQGISGIIAVSSYSRKILSEKHVFDGIPVIIAPNGVDSSMLIERDKNECRKKFCIPENVFVVGFVGAFEERKGDKRVHEAVKQLKDVFVAFAGQGETHRGPEVVFCGKLAREDIPFFFHAIDVFVLPTLSEGCCNAIVEALACGVPVVSSDLPFNDDILSDNNSIRVNPTKINEIRDAIYTLKNDEEKRRRLAEAAKRTGSELTLEERKNKILTFIGIR